MEKSGRWYGVYRKDELQSDGTSKREQRWEPLGLVSEQSKRSAWQEFQPYLDKENAAAKKSAPKIGLTLANFVEEWRTNVAVNLKGSTVRAAESHLRAHIIPKLGYYHLPQITTKIVQSFVAHLAGGGRSRKTAENILLFSLLKRRGRGVMPVEIFDYSLFSSQNGAVLGLCLWRFSLRRPHLAAGRSKSRAAVFHG